MKSRKEVNLGDSIKNSSKVSISEKSVQKVKASKNSKKKKSQNIRSNVDQNDASIKHMLKIDDEAFPSLEVVAKQSLKVSTAVLSSDISGIQENSSPSPIQNLPKNKKNKEKKLKKTEQMAVTKQPKNAVATAQS